MAGDDFILVDPSRDPCVYSLYSTAKLGAQSSAWFKGLHGKQTFDIGDDFEKNIFFVDALGAGPNVRESAPAVDRAAGGKPDPSNLSWCPVVPGRFSALVRQTQLDCYPGTGRKRCSFLHSFHDPCLCCTFRIGTDLDDIGRKMAQKLEGMAR